MSHRWTSDCGSCSKVILVIDRSLSAATLRAEHNSVAFRRRTRYKLPRFLRDSHASRMFHFDASSSSCSSECIRRDAASISPSEHIRPAFGLLTLNAAPMLARSGTGQFNLSVISPFDVG